MTKDPKSLPKDWKETLSPETYRIAREGGTERAFTGKYWNTKDPGTYRCVCCGEPLFHSGEKYESGSGWPSFWKPMDPARVKLRRDPSLAMERTEVVCATCDAHLGHMFDDGPEPSGERYCINSASLDLDPEE